MTTNSMVMNIRNARVDTKVKKVDTINRTTINTTKIWPKSMW